MNIADYLQTPSCHYQSGLDSESIIGLASEYCSTFFKPMIVSNFAQISYFVHFLRLQQQNRLITCIISIFTNKLTRIILSKYAEQVNRIYRGYSNVFVKYVFYFTSEVDIFIFHE